MHQYSVYDLIHNHKRWWPGNRGRRSWGKWYLVAMNLHSAQNLNLLQPSMSNRRGKIFSFVRTNLIGIPFIKPFLAQRIGLPDLRQEGKSFWILKSLFQRKKTSVEDLGRSQNWMSRWAGPTPFQPWAHAQRQAVESHKRISRDSNEWCMRV